jgi:predicted dehydrogenase
MKRLGIIGTGMIAEKHLDAIKKNGRLQVTWLANRGEEKLRKVQQQFSVPNATTDYRELINAADVDAVLICTPPNLHKEMFIDCIQAGKHVFIEKPAAMTLDEIDEMIRAKNAFPELLVCDCSARHSRLQPKFRMVKEIIDSGALGDIYFIHHNSIWRNGRPGIEYHPEAKWFMDKAISGGGPLFDWGVYDLSFHLGVLGDRPVLESVSDVLLQSGHDDFDPGAHTYDVEEMFSAHIRLSGGLRYYWERGNHANMDVPNETRIYGSKAGLKFGFCSWDAPVIHLYDYDGSGKSRHTSIPVPVEGHSDDVALIDHFADLLGGSAKPAMPLELARKHLEIIFRCYEVSEELRS